MDRVIRQINKMESPDEYAITSEVDVLLDHNRGDEILDKITRLYQQHASSYDIACAYAKLMISRKD